MKTLIYKGVNDYVDPRFIAKQGDKVEFIDAEANEKLESSDWEEANLNGNKRKSRASSNTDE